MKELLRMVKSPPSRFGRLLLPGILLLGLVLRIWHVAHGLPGFYEEAIPFRQALEFWETDAGLNPHFFNYPSLSIYLHFLVQKTVYFIGHLLGHYQNPSEFWFVQTTAPGSAVIAGRLIGVAFDALSIWAVFRLGSQSNRWAGPVAAALVAFSPAMILVSREIFVEPIWTALSLWTLERLAAYARDGRRDRLIAAVILCGLAAGTKYNAGLLLFPLALALFYRNGARTAILWPLAAAGSLLVFLITSPYVLLDYSAFVQAFRFESLHMAEGHLGTLGITGASFMLATLVQNVGWVGLIVLLAGVALTITGRRRPSQTEIMVWTFLLPVAGSVAIFRMEALRYVVPVIGPVGLLIGFSLGPVSKFLGSNQRRASWVLAGLATVLLGPALWGGFSAGSTGADSTQARAESWLKKHLNPGDIIIQEEYGAPLPTLWSKQAIMANPHFQRLRPTWQDEFRAVTEYRSIKFPLVVSGNMSVVIEDAGGRRHRFFMFEHAAEFNQVFYQPALLTDVDFFLSSGSVRNRYENNPQRFSAQLDFYRFVEDHGQVVQVFQAGDGVEGSTLVIYQLASENLDREEFDPLWWADPIRQEFRLESESLTLPRSQQSQGEMLDSRGLPSPWVGYARPLFQESVLPFLARLSRLHLEAGHHQTARVLSKKILFMEPDNINACVTYARSSIALGDFQAAENTLRRAIRVSQDRGQDSAGLAFELANLLRAQGQTESAITVLEFILEELPGDSPYRAFVRQKIREWQGK